ncbi:hypothetical protein TWF569_001632 [Orbilia oligospora]|uniref:Uncharacterized protein n=1 Tax=Orbilia oligospora TaxID=2813651 RepID=A0A7C8J611_ORBOL|nr:hypothetical protein TWF102_008872 [Orbilia oligospora]KAF3111155.1 hypothetical protein TWF103_003837 [Orbilia oligospora]KAF3115649.1 hypothetical protein TWF706_005763 [Orbilia oligospora]KAF3123874.1 hypothetical protein TWF569_001632 [Orbilia oligospora]KAF3132959.1 hypothetical protein TWF703_007098 [Orbilia oligospora]
MKFSILAAAACAIGAHTVAAAPTAEPVADNSVNNLQARENNGAGCFYHSPAAPWREFTVLTSGPWTRGNWGRGLLDNLRGQCGLITDWKFEYNGSNGNGKATFKTDLVHPAKCVKDAVWLASGPTNVDVFCHHV